MKKSLWLNSVNQEKILSYQRLKGGVSSEVYKIRTKFVDTKIYFLFLIITDYSFHIKKLKQLIKKIISF